MNMSVSQLSEVHRHVKQSLYIIEVDVADLIYAPMYSNCTSRGEKQVDKHPAQMNMYKLTAMNSALDPTNSLKQSRKFSSVGRI